MKQIISINVMLIIILVTSLAAQEQFTYKLPNYSFHKFKNGFELILIENHTNPLIASVIVVRTGLRNETPQNNGVSHMLEHMTFNGTEKRDQKELYDELDFHGIYLNAQTSEDYTTYMALYHKDKNAISLDIISDMLFNSVFPAEKFEKEKGIIVEEIRKDSERPDFINEQELRKAFYKNPPYSMPVIGTVETVRNLTREQVADYYKTFYSPNNMIAIVIGDFDTADMLAHYEERFGSIPAKEITSGDISLSTNFPFRYIQEDENEQTVYLRFPAPSFYSDQFIPFLFLMEYTLEDRSGYITRTLMDNQNLKLNRVQTRFEFHPEFGLLTLIIKAPKETDADDIQKLITQIFENMKNYQITGEEIEAIKQAKAISEILQTEKILYYGFLKAQELAIGGKDAFEKKIPAFLQLSMQDISEALIHYPTFWSKPDELFKAGTWVEKIESDRYFGESEEEHKGSNKIYRHVYENDFTVIHLQNTDNPVLAMHFLFKNRSAWEPADKIGIVDLLHHCLFKSSEKYNRNDLEIELKRIGAEIKAYDWDFIPYDDYYNVPQYSYIRFVTLDQFFEKAMKITADNIINPILDENFNETKKQMIGLAKRQGRNARNIARLEFLKLLFGKNHPLAGSVTGSQETISNIDLDELTSFHKEYFSTGNTILTIVSSSDSARVFSAVSKYFADMPQTKKSVEIPAIPLTGTEEGDSSQTGKRQSYIYLGYSFDPESEDEINLEVMNDILSSQIAFSLREQKGWAYRLGSSVNFWKDHAYFYASVGTGRETTLPAIKGLKEEITNFSSRKIDAREVEKSQNSMIASLVRRRASRENQAYILGINEFYGYPPTHFFTIFDKIQAVSLKSVNRVTASYLKLNKYKLYYTIPQVSGEKEKMPQGMPEMMKH